MLKKVGESLLALAIGIMCAYGIVCTYAALMGDKILFSSPKPYYEIDKEYVTITSRLGDEIAIYYSPVKNSRYILLYSHGQQEDLGFIRPRLDLFSQHGYSVISYDYPGFGRSTGAKTEEGCYAAIEAVYHYLVDVLEVPAERIISYGRSMGSGPATYLAERFNVGGLVLHGGFVSAYRVQTGIQLIPWDRFENIKRIAHLRVPMLLIHGTADETVPEWHSRLLFQKAPLCVPVQTLFVPYALHNNVVEMAREDYWGSLKQFGDTVKKFTDESPKDLPEAPEDKAVPPVEL